MALKIYDSLAPQGNYPAVNGEDVGVQAAANVTTDVAGIDSNVLRRSFHLGNSISLGSYTAYRVNSLAIRAEAGTEVRFALYEVGDGVLTHLETIGSAVADEDTMTAVLTPENCIVRQDNTIILAFAREAAIHCVQVAEGVSISGNVQFDDADYFDNSTGAQITCYDSSTAEAAVLTSCFARDVDFLTEQTLEDYLKAANGRFADLEEKTGAVLPAVTALDNGKFLRVEGGAWTAVALDDAEGVTF